MVEPLHPVLSTSLMWMEPKDQELVTRTIRRYAEPKGFVDTLSYIVYRVWNAVLSIFGRSDWDRSVAALKRAFPERIAHAVGSVLVTTDDGQTRIDLTRVKEELPRVVTTVGDCALGGIRALRSLNPLPKGAFSKGVAWLSGQQELPDVGPILDVAPWLWAIGGYFLQQLMGTLQPFLDRAGTHILMKAGLSDMRPEWCSEVPKMVMSETTLASRCLEAAVAFQEGREGKVREMGKKAFDELKEWFEGNYRRLLESQLVKAVKKGIDAGLTPHGLVEGLEGYNPNERQQEQVVLHLLTLLVRGARVLSKTGGDLGQMALRRVLEWVDIEVHRMIMRQGDLSQKMRQFLVQEGIVEEHQLQGRVEEIRQLLAALRGAVQRAREERVDLTVEERQPLARFGIRVDTGILSLPQLLEPEPGAVDGSSDVGDGAVGQAMPVSSGSPIPTGEDDAGEVV